VELRLGRWQDALAGVTCDLLLTDPPFSARTHEGALGTKDKTADMSTRADISFPPWTVADVESFVDAWAPRVRRWFAVMTDSILAPHFRAEFKGAGLIDFAPVPIVFTDGGVRLNGDGPPSVSLSLVVARRVGNLSGGRKIWRSTRGYYLGATGPDQAGGRGKPEWLLGQIVADYSDPGHVVCDPMAGYGQTLASARNAGRVAIGSEADPAAHAAALANLSGDRTAFRRLLPSKPDKDAGTPSLFDARSP
jgi:site-specific DNA-methyltransferase (adenine-specific)